VKNMLENLSQAVALLLSWHVLFYLSLGLIIGIILGAIPGLGGTMGVGVLLPLTFTLPILDALVLLTGIYKGTLVGGSFSAILINTPGDAPAAATCLDGHPLSQQGNSRKALQAAIWGSGLGDLFADCILFFGSVTLAPFVLKFGPSEIFWVGSFP
jgi:putative tricarboxylic transport membrane protein